MAVAQTQALLRCCTYSKIDTVYCEWGLASAKLIDGSAGMSDLLAFPPAIGYVGGKAGQAVGLLSKNCFVAGTLVAVGLEDGQIIARPIEAIAVGDTVLARSEFDPEGPLEEIRVSQAFVRTALALQRGTILQEGGTTQTLQTTPEHPFYVEGRGWTQAKDLRPGDLLLTPEGGHEAVAASELELHPEGVRVYNFEVEGAHTYFVDADAAIHGGVVWVHNASYGNTSDIIRLARPNRVMCEGREIGAARDLGHLKESTLRKMISNEVNCAGRDMHGRTLHLHHMGQKGRWGVSGNTSQVTSLRQSNSTSMWQHEGHGAD